MQSWASLTQTVANVEKPRKPPKKREPVVPNILYTPTIKKNEVVPGIELGFPEIWISKSDVMTTTLYNRVTMVLIRSYHSWTLRKIPEFQSTTFWGDVRLHMNQLEAWLRRLQLGNRTLTFSTSVQKIQTFFLRLHVTTPLRLGPAWLRCRNELKRLTSLPKALTTLWKDPINNKWTSIRLE